MTQAKAIYFDDKYAKSSASGPFGFLKLIEASSSRPLAASRAFFLNDGLCCIFVIRLMHSLNPRTTESHPQSIRQMSEGVLARVWMMLMAHRSPSLGHGYRLDGLANALRDRTRLPGLSAPFISILVG